MATKLGVAQAFLTPKSPYILVKTDNYSFLFNKKQSTISQQLIKRYCQFSALSVLNTIAFCVFFIYYTCIMS